MDETGSPPPTDPLADPAGAVEARPRIYLFGDLLALARAQWIRSMAAGVAALGYDDYRPTDAVLVRLLRRRGPMPIGRIGERLGITRQGARKLLDGLERRGYAAAARDESDARVVKVGLTSAGDAYAEAVIAVLDRLNRELAARVDRDDLAIADAVLRASIADPAARAAMGRLVAPP